MAMDLADAATKENARMRRAQWVKDALELVEERTARLVGMAAAVLDAGKRNDPMWHEVCPEEAAGDWARHSVDVSARGVEIEWRSYDSWGGHDSLVMFLTAEDLADPEEGARRQRRQHEAAIRDEKARRAYEAALAGEREVERRRRQYELDKLDFEPGGRLA